MNHPLGVLGKQPPQHDDRTLRLARYLAPTWDFFTTYGDEAYAVLSQDFLDATRRAPTGVDIDQLRRDLARL